MKFDPIIFVKIFWFKNKSLEYTKFSTDYSTCSSYSCKMMLKQNNRYTRKS